VKRRGLSVTREGASVAGVKYFGCGLALAVVCWVAPVWAQSSDTKAAAEALFVEGRNLMVQGKFDAACQKFEASQKLDPGLGTMLNLADCYEKSGRTASAWAEYREAIPAARASGSEDRAKLAEERAKALESRLSTLTIQVMAESTGADLEVLRDGIPVDRAVLSTPIPVDPGAHTIAARAPGYEPWSTEVSVGAEGDKVSVEVPALVPQNVASAPASGADPKATTVESDGKRSGSSQKTWGIVTGSVGVAGLGAGLVFVLLANSELSAAKEGCPTYPNGCSSENYSRNDKARTFADISTVSFIAGGAFVGLGTVLWLTAPSSSDKSVEVGLGPSSLVIKGTF
jgi:hypothetical protein